MFPNAKKNFTHYYDVPTTLCHREFLVKIQIGVPICFLVNLPHLLVEHILLEIPFAFLPMLNCPSIHITVYIHIAYKAVLATYALRTQEYGRGATQRHYDNIPGQHETRAHSDAAPGSVAEAPAHHPIAEMHLQELPGFLGLRSAVYLAVKVIVEVTGKGHVRKPFSEQRRKHTEAGVHPLAVSIPRGDLAETLCSAKHHKKNNQKNNNLVLDITKQQSPP